MTDKRKEKIKKELLEEDINWIYINEEINKYHSKNSNLDIEDLTEIFEEVFKENIAPPSTKYGIKENSIDSSIILIMEKLLNELNTEVPRNQIINEINEDSSLIDKIGVETIKNQEDLFKKSFMYIKRLLLADYRKESKYTYYKANINKWFEYRRYYICNVEILKNLLPILIGYLKSEKNCSIDKFFEVIDNLIKYLIQPYENSNDLFDIENVIINNIYEDLEIKIFDINSKQIPPHRDIVIEPQRVIINSDNSRTIEYLNENLDTKTIDIKNIIRVKLDKEREGAVKHKTGKYFYLYNKNFLIEEKIEKKYLEEKNYEIILEVPTSTYEYFRLKPLMQQQLFHTPREIEYFKEVYKINDIKDNHFYVVARDTIKNTSSIVFHIINNVKIIEPQELRANIINKMEEYISKIE